MKKSFSEILQEEPWVLVDFYTEWCGPCKMMKTILEDFHLSIGDRVRILKVDVDKNPRAAVTYQVRGVPTLALFNHGKMIWKQAGVVSSAFLKDLVDKYQRQNASDG